MSTRLEEYADAPESSGIITFNRDWYLLRLSQEFHNLLLGKLSNVGVPFSPIYNPHISVMKNEAPSQNQADWGVAFVGDEVSFQYSETLRNDNGFHFWVDCYSPKLCQLREYFGLPTLKTDTGIYLVNFHTTIGKRETPIEPKIRAHFRLTVQSHIDVETGMQHL